MKLAMCTIKFLWPRARQPCRCAGRASAMVSGMVMHQGRQHIAAAARPSPAGQPCASTSHQHILPASIAQDQAVSATVKAAIQLCWMTERHSRRHDQAPGQRAHRGCCTAINTPAHRRALRKHIMPTHRAGKPCARSDYHSHGQRGHSAVLRDRMPW